MIDILTLDRGNERPGSRFRREGGRRHALDIHIQVRPYGTSTAGLPFYEKYEIALGAGGDRSRPSRGA